MKALLGAVLALGTVTSLAADPHMGWVGTYQTKQTQLVSSALSDNYLTITRMSGGGVRFTFEAASAGCIGEVDFRAPQLPKGTDMLLSKTDDSGGVCLMRLHLEGRTIVAAEDGCDSFRGMQCTFSGTYKPEGRR